jgi:hypothetical protein
MRRIFSIGSLSVIGLLMVACAADGTTSGPTSSDPSGSVPPDEENVAQAESALLSGYWTSLTSEERRPESCPSGYVVDALQATGSYSDNVGLHCGHIGRASSQQSWSDNFSEEGSASRRCDTNQFLVGIACAGRYCDNVSIQCASLRNTTAGSNCYWTEWFSEEKRFQYLFSGYAAAGLRCKGRYCDDMSIYGCPIVRH